MSFWLFASPFSNPNIFWCLLLPVSARLLAWPSVSPPPMCLWWIWPSAWRNLWVLFPNLHDKNGFSWVTSIWHPLAFHASSTGQVWWHQESGQGCSWWTHERHSGIHRGPGMHIKLSKLWVSVLKFSIMIFLFSLCAGGVHWLQRGLSFFYLWCRCWHCPQWSLCQAGHMVRYCLQLHLKLQYSMQLSDVITNTLLCSFIYILFILNKPK